MATKQEIRARAKALIEIQPTAGKTKINQQLKQEFGVGLRSSTVLRLKAEVASEKPALYPQLYAMGGVVKGFNEIYRGYLRAGFLAFEARELTLGHGERYRAFDARAVYDSAPAIAARQTRINWVRDLLKQGWTKQQIRQNIIDFYRRSKKLDIWQHIRSEYKPRKRVDYREYKTKARKRAKSSQRRLIKRMDEDEWVAELKQSMKTTRNEALREQYRRQIINLGGTP